MTAREEADGSVVLTHDTRLWSELAAGAAALFLLTAAYDYVIGRHGDDRLIGLFGGAAAMGLIAYVMSERSHFHVDRSRRRIDWQQGFAFRMRSGSIAFEDVRHVSLQTPIGDRGVPSRRVMIHLVDNSLVPVTVGYRPDGDGAVTTAAELMRAALGHGQAIAADTAQLLIAGGKKFEAIRVLMDQEGLSLADAKRRVEGMRND